MLIGRSHDERYPPPAAARLFLIEMLMSIAAVGAMIIGVTGEAG
jgi:hypothetical protein